MAMRRKLIAQPSHDGVYVVQANVSASKASQYVHTILHDTVSLNAQGGATHLLQIRLVYNQIGPVYGYDTYHDYLRVYVPPNSKFLWGDGFDTGKQLCGAYLAACPQYDVYPKDELLCPAGEFQPGAQAPPLPTPMADAGIRWIQSGHQLILPVMSRGVQCSAAGSSFPKTVR